MPQPLVPLAVPPQACLPATAQGLIDLAAQYLGVQFPTNYTQIVISDTTPAPADNGKIWLKVDGSGNPIGFFKYAGGVWTAVTPQNVFFGIDTGAANAISVNISNYPYATQQNGLFIVKVKAENTGATTLAINAFGAVAVKIGGADPYAKAFLADRWYAFTYTGTTFEPLNPSDPQPTIGVRVIKSGLAVATQTVSLGPDITGYPSPVEVWFECVTGQHGYNPGDRIKASCIVTDYTGAAADGPYVMETAGAGVVTLTLVATPTAINITNKVTGASEQPFTPANWNFVVIAYA